MEKCSGLRLRIFIGENDSFDHRPLYDVILGRAREHNLAGATVFRGIAGFGGDSHMHESKLLSISENLPLLVEIIDSEEKVRAFLPELDELIEDGAAALDQVEFIRYKK